MAPLKDLNAGSTPELSRKLEKRRLSNPAVYENSPEPRPEAPVVYPFPFDHVRTHWTELQIEERLRAACPDRVVTFAEQLHLPDRVAELRVPQRVSAMVPPALQQLSKLEMGLCALLALCALWIGALQCELSGLRAEAGAPAICPTPVCPAPEPCPVALDSEPCKTVDDELEVWLGTDGRERRTFGADEIFHATNASSRLYFEYELERKGRQHHECITEFQTHLEMMLQQYALDRTTGVRAPQSALMDYAMAVESRLVGYGYRIE